MHTGLLLALVGLLACVGSAAAAMPRVTWAGEAGTPQLNVDGAPLLETLAEPSYAATPWRVEDGALAWNARAGADSFAIRRSGGPAAEVIYSGDVRIVEGDVAGLVLRAREDGSECFAALLGAQSKALRLVYLPWPGRDLLVKPYPVELNRTYRLQVHWGTNRMGCGCGWRWTAARWRISSRWSAVRREPTWA